MNNAPTRLDALSLVVLQLHRGSREWPSASFAPRAAELLAGLIPHRASLWGSVRADAPSGSAPVLQGLHTQGLTPEELAACLAGLAPQPDLQAQHLEPLAGRRVLLQLWRSPQAAAYDEADRQTLHFLMPHLVEAQRENRLGRPQTEDSTQAPRRSHALCDAEGVLQQVDEQSLALLRTEWPRWAATRLPEPLAAAATLALGNAGDAPDSFHGRHITVLMTRSGSLLLLEVRRRAAVDRLSARQRDIALLYAQGLTGPQIATQLGLSSSTVNNHLGVVFKKLAVSNKVQLLNAVRARDAV